MSIDLDKTLLLRAIEGDITGAIANYCGHPLFQPAASPHEGIAESSRRGQTTLIGSRIGPGYFSTHFSAAIAIASEKSPTAQQGSQDAAIDFGPFLAPSRR